MRQYLTAFSLALLVIFCLEASGDNLSIYHDKMETLHQQFTQKYFALEEKLNAQPLLKSKYLPMIMGMRRSFEHTMRVYLKNPSMYVVGAGKEERLDLSNFDPHGVMNAQEGDAEADSYVADLAKDAYALMWVEYRKLDDLVREIERSEMNSGLMGGLLGQ